MADSPMPIAATVREAIEQTAHIERLAGQIDGAQAQKQKWFLDPKWWTIIAAVSVPAVTGMWKAIDYFDEARHRGVEQQQRLGAIETKLSIATEWKPQLDQVARDVSRLDGTVTANRETVTGRLDAIETSRASIRDAILQRMSALETRAELTTAALHDLSAEVHRLNERLSDRRTQIYVPPAEATVNFPMR